MTFKFDMLKYGCMCIGGVDTHRTRYGLSVSDWAKGRQNKMVSYSDGFIFMQRGGIYMQSQVKAGYKNNLTTFIRYMIPGLISMMLLAAYGFTDTFVVGRKLGAAAVGAMGICTPVLTITYAFGFLFGMGGASLYAISLGQQNTKKASEFFNTAIFCSTDCECVCSSHSESGDCPIC